MKTFNLQEAADFLKLHPEEVRRRAKAGRLPGAKLGKRWSFIEEDLVEYMRSFYAQPRQALQVVHEKEDQSWPFSNVERRGGLTSPHQAASELDALLEQKLGSRRKSSTTS